MWLWSDYNSYMKQGKLLLYDNGHCYLKFIMLSIEKLLIGKKTALICAEQCITGRLYENSVMGRPWHIQTKRVCWLYTSRESLHVDSPDNLYIMMLCLYLFNTVIFSENISKSKQYASRVIYADNTFPSNTWLIRINMDTGCCDSSLTYRTGPYWYSIYTNIHRNSRFATHLYCHIYFHIQSPSHNMLFIIFYYKNLFFIIFNYNLKN